MEATFKNRDIKAIIDGTVWEHEPYTEGEQTANMAVIGYYAPSGANWSYHVGIANRDGKTYILIKRFGGVVGVKELYTGSEWDKRGEA